jgi:hypothetical protein
MALAQLRASSGGSGAPLERWRLLRTLMEPLTGADGAAEKAKLLRDEPDAPAFLVAELRAHGVACVLLTTWGGHCLRLLTEREGPSGFEARAVSARAAGGVAALVAAADAHASNAQAQEAALWALLALVDDEASGAAFARAGVLRVTAAALRTHPDSRGVVQKAAVLIELLASNPAVRCAASAAGIADAFVAALRTHAGNVIVVHASCAALAVCCCRALVWRAPARRAPRRRACWPAARWRRCWLRCARTQATHTCRAQRFGRWATSRRATKPRWRLRLWAAFSTWPLPPRSRTADSPWC